ncbi:MAG TPA: LLM class F420-dependent oxidoreductase [Acidimicrobiales bacterium]|nr:LLM class F420-dependent oxidoreductase [Acidimicrobiales bacterium]
MQIGVVFPQTEIGGDAGAVRAYATRVQELGYAHLIAYDHVVGADPAVHRGWNGPYDLHSTFHEPLVLFGYLAGLTSLELVTGIIILPQRQTALVAKQAAEVDLLTGGRFRLGVGLGWNAVEYEALGKTFSDRGRRVDDQVELLRRLWTQPSVTYESADEHVTGAGLAPLPVQRPIPIWFGAASPPAYRRAGRLGDGWFPLVPPGPKLDEARALVEAAAVGAGRDPGTLGLEGRVNWGEGGATALADHARRWRAIGATHLTVNTMGAGLGSVDGHLDALTSAAEVLEVGRG